MVGALAAIARIVAYRGLLLMPEDGDHGAVQIEDEPRAMFGQVNEMAQQAVVHALHLLAERGGCVEQEAAQRLRVRETLQTGPILECAVGAEERSGLPTVQAQDQRIDQRQDHLRQTVAVIASGIHEMTSKEIAELQQSEKLGEEINAAKVRQTSMITGDFGFRGDLRILSLT